MAYNFQTLNNKIKLLTEYESLTQKVLFGNAVLPILQEFLDMHFPGHWVWRDGPIKWPLRSPDNTPFDFFLWGYFKDMFIRHL
jgi:hypothetical protein